METYWQLLGTIVLAAFLGREVFTTNGAEVDKSGPRRGAAGGAGFGAMTGMPIVAALIALGAPAAGVSFALGFFATLLATAAACGGWLATRRQERTDRDWE